MASTSGSKESSREDFFVKGSREGVASSSGRGDLPSKCLLGKGLNSIGYETVVNGKRCARQDFVGVPSVIFKEEASVLVELEPHEHVVETIGWTVDNRSCSLVSEYIEDTLLVFLLKRKGLPPSPAQPFDMPQKLETMWQIASGMESLHEQGVSHGDLKTRNILVKYNDKSRTMKVADYGRFRSKRKSMAFASRQARKRDMVRWKAPELLGGILRRDSEESSSESDTETGECVSSSSILSEIYWRSGVPAAYPSNIHNRECSADVYSFAVMCSQILLDGEEPYPDVRRWKELAGRIVADEIRPTLPDHACCPELITLLNFCLGTEPSLRPQFWYIRRALERLLPSPQGILSATPYMIDHLNQYTLAARVFIAAHLIRSLIGADESNPLAGYQYIQRTLEEMPMELGHLALELNAKLLLLCKYIQNGMMEWQALNEVAAVVNALSLPSWMHEELDGVNQVLNPRVPSAEGQNRLSWKTSFRSEVFLDTFNLVTQLGVVLLDSAPSAAWEEFWELLEEWGRKIATFNGVQLRVPNLDKDELRKLINILKGNGLTGTFDESKELLTVTGFIPGDYEGYVLELVRKVTSSASIITSGDHPGRPQIGTDQQEFEREELREIPELPEFTWHKSERF